MAQWRHKIKLNGMDVDNPTNEDIKRIAGSIAKQLERIIKVEEDAYNKRVYNALPLEYIDEMYELKEHFSWIEECIDRGDDPADFGFVGWIQAFDEYLEQLYDLGDTLVKQGKTIFNDEKLIWVGQ